MAGQVAQRFGAIATFMAKPFADRTGSGAHMHYHLADAETGANLFLDESDPRGLGLSQLAYHFLGGVLAHAPALCAVTSPTVNCYKRLQIGPALTGSRSGYTWVPAFITYGDNNRTQMLRVPEPATSRTARSPRACNPYLAIAAYLAAGLDGIARQLDPGEPNLGNLYEAEPRRPWPGAASRPSPRASPEALDHLEADPVVREALGPIADEFLRLKRDEWREYHAQVESWEIRAIPDGAVNRARRRFDASSTRHVVMEHLHARNVVLGAGAMGSAAAYHLARRGEPVVLVEQFALGHDRGSSHGAARITRHSYADPRYARLMPDGLPRLAGARGRRRPEPLPPHRRRLVLPAGRRLRRRGSRPAWRRSTSRTGG